MDTIPPKIQLKNALSPLWKDELPHGLKIVASWWPIPYSPLSFNKYIEQAGLPQVLCIGAEGGWIDYEVSFYKIMAVSLLV